MPKILDRQSLTTFRLPRDLRIDRQNSKINCKWNAGVMINRQMLDTLSLLLILAGALNWGVIGMIDLNLLEYFLGEFPSAIRMIYVLIGIAGFLFTYREIETCRQQN